MRAPPAAPAFPTLPQPLEPRDDLDGGPAVAAPGAGATDERKLVSGDALGDRLKRFGRSRGSEESAHDDDYDEADDRAGDDFDRPAVFRPVPPPQTPPSSSLKRTAILGGILAVVVILVAALAIRLKDNPEDYARARAPVATQEAENSSGKLVDRVGGPATRATSQKPGAPESGIPVAQRAAILVDAPDDPQKVKTYIGSVVWHLDPAPGAPPVLVADIDISNANIKAVVRISRNLDPKLPASHTMEIQFAPGPDSPIPGVKAIDTPQMRLEDRPTGDPMNAVPAPIMANYFLVGMTNSDAAVARNLDLMKTRAWFDIPLLLTNDRFARLTFEKGAAGDRAMTQALQAWQP